MRIASTTAVALAAAVGLWAPLGAAQTTETSESKAEAKPAPGAPEKPRPGAKPAANPKPGNAADAQPQPKAAAPKGTARTATPVQTAAPAGKPVTTAAQIAPKGEPAAAPESSTQSSLSGLAIDRRQLKNGLRVVMSSDRTIPTVAVAVYYDVGSRNEARGRSGFAHLFEHMMFQGSANVDKGEHFQLILNRGGSMNGTTSADRTNYFETLPSNELELALWLEADRMKSLAITQENFENQRQTVMEERRQSYDNRPYAQSFLRINELAYGDYWPYSHSTIGHMEDLEAAPLEAVQKFFDTYYAPNNAVLSIVGDFDPEGAMALVEKHFGDIPANTPPVYDPGELAPQTAERTETMLDPIAPLPAFHIDWHIPKSREADHYALELLAIILGDGESSRLYQLLVKKKELLQQLSIATDDRRGPDLFSIWAVSAEGKKPEAARKVIFDEFASVQRKGVTARELQKAKNRVQSMFVFGLQSNLSRAMMLSTFELYWGDAGLLTQELARYQGVTAEDIKRVANTYFSETNRTILDVSTAQSGSAGDAK